MHSYVEVNLMNALRALCVCILAWINSLTTARARTLKNIETQLYLVYPPYCCFYYFIQTSLLSFSLFLLSHCRWNHHHLKQRLRNLRQRFRHHHLNLSLRFSNKCNHKCNHKCNNKWYYKWNHSHHHKHKSNRRWVLFDICWPTFSSQNSLIKPKLNGSVPLSQFLDCKEKGH